MLMPGLEFSSSADERRKLKNHVRTTTSQSEKGYSSSYFQPEAPNTTPALKSSVHTAPNTHENAARNQHKVSPTIVKWPIFPSIIVILTWLSRRSASIPSGLSARPNSTSSALANSKLRFVSCATRDAVEKSCSTEVCARGR